MKKLFGVLAVWMMLLLSSACAEEWEPAPDGWTFVGYTYGGIEFALPDDSVMWELSEEEENAGVIFLAGNADFTVQLRQFTPDQLDYETFVDLIRQTESAEYEEAEVGGGPVFRYRNTKANENSELYGAALTGLDGNLYKISIFTGEDGDYSENAKVWQIAEELGQTVRSRDYSFLEEAE